MAAVMSCGPDAVLSDGSAAALYEILDPLDQAHVAAGLTALRFTHAQVHHEPGYVRGMLATVARRLAAG
jgi:hypothetical protein